MGDGVQHRAGQQHQLPVAAPVEQRSHSPGISQELLKRLVGRVDKAIARRAMAPILASG